MSEEVVGEQDRWLGAWIGLVRRRAAAVLLAGLALAAASLYYTVGNLTVNTDTTDMISEEVPFRRNWIAFRDAFPNANSPLVVVVDAPTPELARATGAALAERLGQRPDLFRDVYRPVAEPYFRRNGLLFLDTDALAELTDRLAAAEPLLATLAADPSARGLYRSIGLAVTQGADQLGEDGAGLAPVLSRMAEIVEAQVAGRPEMLSWDRLMRPGAAPGAAARDFILVDPVLDHTGLDPAAPAMDAVRRLGAAVGIDGTNGAALRLTGPAALDQEELQSLKTGVSFAGLFSLALVAILLVLGLGSLRLVAATVITLLTGLVWTAGFAALSVGHLNLISVAFAVLFIGLGVDFSIHFSLRHREEVARGQGHDKDQNKDHDKGRNDALVDAAQGVARPLMLSAVCAAAGFYAFLPTDYLGLAELGFISGGGMFIAMIANFTVFPALLALLPGGRGAVPPAAPRFAAVQQGIARHHRKIVSVAALFGIAALAAPFFARFDFNPLNLKDPASESVAVFLELAAEDGAAAYAIDLLADDVAAAGAEARRLAALPEVDRAISLTSFVPADQDEKLELIDGMAIFLAPVLEAGDPAERPGAAAHGEALDLLKGRLDGFAAPGSDQGGSSQGGSAMVESARRLAAAFGQFRQRFGDDGAALDDLDHRLTAYLPGFLDDLQMALTARQVRAADIPRSIRSRWLAADGRARVQILPPGGTTDNAALRAFAEAVFTAAPGASGGPVTINEAGKSVIAAFKEATLWAVLAMVVILAVVLRRPLGVILVLAPLVLAALLMTATAVLFGLPFNFANIIVLPLLFGLGASSAIHLVMRQTRVASTRDVLASSTPRAVLYSTLTTIASFGSLMLSGHRGMTSMGALLTIALACTLVSTLVVLPALMVGLERRRAGAT